MLPITGPFIKSLVLRDPPRPSGYQAENFQMNRTWKRQRPPFDLPLPYLTTVKQVVSQRFYDESDPLDGANGYFDINNYCVLGDPFDLQVALEKAYSKLGNKVSSFSQWANNVIEARKTYDGAVMRIKQLIQFTLKILKRDLVGAGRVLGMGVPSGARKKGKSLSGLWLEYHFGWEPLVADIYAGVGALGRDFTSSMFSAGARSDKILILKKTNSGAGLVELDRIEYTTRVRQACRVRVVNPNATLLNDLGLANPVSIVWETIPFSFVVDWFSTVGSVISSATDFLGVEVLDAHRSWRIRTYRYYNIDQFVIGHYPKRAGAIGQFNGVYAGREVGLVGPTLHFKPFQGFSTTRGGTAIALLIQLLPKH